MNYQDLKTFYFYKKNVNYQISFEIQMKHVLGSINRSLRLAETCQTMQKVVEEIDLDQDPLAYSISVLLVITSSPISLGSIPASVTIVLLLIHIFCQLFYFHLTQGS